MLLGFHIGFLEISWVDLIDIFMVSILLYQVYKLMRGSVAIKIFLGFLSLYLIFLVVKAADMELLTIILGQFMGVGVIAVIILFQQEIRKFLLLLGRTTIFDEGNILKNLKSLWQEKYDPNYLNISPIIDAIKSLGGSNTGALIVFSKDTELKFYADSGDRMDALVSKRLLLSIFNKYSPLHDGAVIIYNNRIISARCILPVSEQDNLPAHFGLRHRAAVGMSETTDTLVVVVSEETGQLSVVRGGIIEHNLSAQEIRKKVNAYLYNEEEQVTEKETGSKKSSPLLEKLKKEAREKEEHTTGSDKTREQKEELEVE